MTEIQAESRPNKCGTASVWVDLGLLADFRKAVKTQGTSTLSEELNAFFRKRTAEIRGVALDPNSPNEEAGRRYEELKERHSSMVCQLDKMEGRLKKVRSRDGVILYDEACKLLDSVGIRADFSNAKEVVPKFMAAWRGSQESMHEYITFVEVVKEKKEVEMRLREIRDVKPVGAGSVVAE